MEMYCWRSGEVEIGRTAPEGTIIVARGPRRALEARLRARGRLAYDNTTMLVPGLPEAQSDDDATSAIERFSDLIMLGSSGERRP